MGHKIKVTKKNEFNILFDMVTDDLPAEGEYHLVPVGQEYLFTAEHIEYRYRELKAIAEITEGLRKNREYQVYIAKVRSDLEKEIKDLRNEIENIKAKP